MTLFAGAMHAVLHLPTLTALVVDHIGSDAWPLLPQLPRLRGLRLMSSDPLTPNQMPAMCAALSRCSMLVDLDVTAGIESADRKPLDAEQGRATWAALLSSVPHLRRLDIRVDMAHLISVLPSHLPLLEHLVLRGWCNDPEDFASLAHPNVRQLDLVSIKELPSRAQLRASLHSKRFPKLERCIRQE
jgi:hypothetical protein